MIYLVSFLDTSYAKREMQNTRCFLNKLCNTEIAYCVHGITELEKVLNTNFLGDTFVIADYRNHPGWKAMNSHYRNIADNLIHRIPIKDTVMWIGDIRFKRDWEQPKFAIGNYMSVFMPLTYDGISYFAKAFKQLVLPITWKTMLPALKYDYSLSESQCYWGDFELADKQYDLTYIAHGGLRDRYADVQYLEHCTGKIVTGQLSKYYPDKIFQNTGNITEINYKVYNKDWLHLLSTGKYTIITDIDNLHGTQHLSSRFWESIRADVIPIVHLSKDEHRQIYSGYPNLQANAYFNDGIGLNKLIKFQPNYNLCLQELQQFKQQYVGRML